MTDLTKITTPFGLLDPETKDALWDYNGQLEAYCGGMWSGVSRYDIDPDFTYRARPATLVPDTICWKHVAPEWKWMARDGNGKTYLFTNNPVTLHDRWVADEGEYARIEGVLSSYRRGTVAWQDSLVQRPEGV